MGGATLLLTCMYPIAFCLGCDPPPPWQREVPDFVYLWLAGAPFLAALLALQDRLLVPTASVLALLLAQPIGGVSSSSYVANEWPFITLFGSPMFFASFGAGTAARKIAAAYFARRI